MRKRLSIDEERSAEGSLEEDSFRSSFHSSSNSQQGESFKRDFFMADSFTLKSHAQNLQSMYPLSRDGQMDYTKDDMAHANTERSASLLNNGEGGTGSSATGVSATLYRRREQTKSDGTAWRSKWLDDASHSFSSAGKISNLQEQGLGAGSRRSSLTSGLFGSGRMLTGGVYSGRGSFTTNSSFSSLHRGSLGAGSFSHHRGPTKGSWLERIAGAGSSSNMFRSQVSISSQRSSSSTSRLLQGDLEWFSDSDSLFSSSAQQADDNVSFNGSWAALPGGEIFARNQSNLVSVSSSEEEFKDDDMPTDLVGGGSFRQPSATTRLLAEFASVNSTALLVASSEAQQSQEAMNAAKTKANSKPFAPGFFRRLPENNAGASDEPREMDEDAFDVNSIARQSDLLNPRQVSGSSLGHPVSVQKRERGSSIDSSSMGDKFVDVVGSMTTSLQNVLESSFNNSMNKMFKGSFKKSFKNSFKMSRSFKGTKARRRARPQAETFRIVLPNGSHLSGLSSSTFGNGARVQVSRQHCNLQQTLQ